jgi:Na+/proline symporter
MFIALAVYQPLAILLALIAIVRGWIGASRKIIRLSKVNNITSIADFIASRYGKSSVIGGLVTVISIVGIMPYIALQLKSISSSFNVLFHFNSRHIGELWAGHDTALYVALVLAVFSILFGTRHIDVTERHEGMVAAIAFESIVKLLAFSAVGIYVTFMMFEGPADLFRQAAFEPETAKLMTMEPLPGGYASWLTLTFISMTAIMFLPRQFQVLVVENVNEKHVRTASWETLVMFAAKPGFVPIRQCIQTCLMPRSTHC